MTDMDCQNGSTRVMRIGLCVVELLKMIRILDAKSKAGTFFDSVSIEFYLSPKEFQTCGGKSECAKPRLSLYRQVVYAKRDFKASFLVPRFLVPRRPPLCDWSFCPLKMNLLRTSTSKFSSEIFHNNNRVLYMTDGKTSEDEMEELGINKLSTHSPCVEINAVYLLLSTMRTRLKKPKECADMTYEEYWKTHVRVDDLIAPVEVLYPKSIGLEDLEQNAKVDLLKIAVMAQQFLKCMTSVDVFSDDTLFAAMELRANGWSCQCSNKCGWVHNEFINVGRLSGGMFCNEESDRESVAEEDVDVLDDAVYPERMIVENQ